MKELRIKLDENIVESLEKMAKDLGLKLGPYIQMVLGVHVREKSEATG